MKRTSLIPALTLTVLLSGPTSYAMSIAHIAASTQQTQQPDNSAQNAHQGENASSHFSAKDDRDLAAKIRRAIIADKGMSLYAYNCKVLVTGGKVTLKGPVKSEEEKQKIAADAASVASADSITNQLTIKP